MVVHPHCCSWASSGKSQHHNECNQIDRAASMFVSSALSSSRCSFTHLLPSHFTLWLFGLLLFTFLLISICFTPLRDLCMLIHWITQLTHYFAYFLSSSIGLEGKMLLQTSPSCSSTTRSWIISKLYIFWMLLLRCRQPFTTTPRTTHSQKQQQASNKSDKQLNNWSTSIFCRDSLHWNLYPDSSHIHYFMLIPPQQLLAIEHHLCVLLNSGIQA